MECGADGCGGICGECLPDQYCIGFKCPDPGKQCDDGNTDNWDGCNADGQVGEFFVVPTELGNTCNDDSPAVAAWPDGRFVVTWRCGDIYARVFDADGTAAAEPFQVSTGPVRGWDGPAVATLAGGQVIISWHGGDGDAYGVATRILNVQGGMTGEQFSVNDYTTSEQWFPAFAPLADGRVIVVWQSHGQDGDAWGLYGRYVNADGSFASAEFPITTQTQWSQLTPAVAASSDGRFRVAWCREPAPNDGDADIFVQRFLPDGSPLGTEFMVNTYEGYWQGSPAVADLGQNGWVVVWMDKGQQKVCGQRYGTDDQPIGGEFQVNVSFFDYSTKPRVSAADDTWFVVTWSGECKDFIPECQGLVDDSAIRARIFAADGWSGGDELTADIDVDHHAQQPGVAAFPQGGFVVVWKSFGQADPLNDWDVFAQRFDQDGNKLYH